MHKSSVLIIGSGPAGYTSAIYTTRQMLKTTLISGIQPGGQLSITTDVENFPGFKEVQGPDLMEKMKEQALSCGADIKSDHIHKIDLSSTPFRAWGGGEIEYQADSVIIASGASAKWLGIDAEKRFLGFGVSACATCDGFFFSDKEVIVIGGANTAVEEAIYLAKLCKKVTIVYRGVELRSEQILKDRLSSLKNVEVLYRKVLVDLKGEDNPKRISAAFIKDLDTNNTTELACEGCFVAIGHRPNTEIFKNQLDLDAAGYILVKPEFSPFTSKKGVFAAGDVQDKVYRQAVTAAGSGCMAALEAIRYLG
ncbi:MAG: thioredoxin-disulfide reductase [SAR324 cluster bacterium]|nr:thioredoxin-disulfide reductase [SAR324 cluster bacterium]